MAKISLDYPNYPKGEELEVPGVGYVKNGSSVDLEDEQVAAWEQMNGLKFPKGGTLELPLSSTAKTKTPQPPAASSSTTTNDSEGGN